MRIFLLGDSFTYNLFEKEFEKIISNKIAPYDYEYEMFKYVNQFYEKEKKPPFHFSDWLKEWGYDVYNFAKGGASLDEIIHQFGNIPLDYEEGDRIILNLTHYSRFMWFIEENKYIQVVPFFNTTNTDSNTMNLLQEQCIERNDNVNSNGYLKVVYFKFIDYLIKKHSNYNPIVWTPFEQMDLHFQNNSYFFKHNILFDKSCCTISVETLGNIDDGHYATKANYILATSFDTIIKNNINSDYNNINLKNKIDKIKLINRWPTNNLIKSINNLTKLI